MITHTIDSYQIPSENKTKSKKQIWKFCKILKLWNLAKIVKETHLLKLFNEMGKYEIDLAGIVEFTEQTWFCTQMDRQMDGQTGVKSVYPPSNFIEARCIIGSHSLYKL